MPHYELAQVDGVWMITFHPPANNNNGAPILSWPVDMPTAGAVQPNTPA